MIRYEVRRISAVVTTRDDARSALAFAEANSHFPGQLKVWAVEHREWEVTEPAAEPIPFNRTARARR